MVSITNFVTQPETFVDWSQPDSPRVLHHSKIISGAVPDPKPPGYWPWSGDTIVRLPQIAQGATELNPDGTLPQAKGKNGEPLFVDKSVGFEIPVDLNKPLVYQIAEALEKYDTLARQCAEDVTKEYAEFITAEAERIKRRALAGNTGGKSIILPGSSAAARPEPLVDENLNIIKP